MEYPEQKANPSEIEEALKALGADGLYFGHSIDYSTIGLSPQEFSYFESIGSPKRARQFAAGRNAARLALKKIPGKEQLQSWPLIRLESGLVNWPLELVGSISHCQEIAIAVLAEKNKIKSVGLDLEFYREVSEATIARIAELSELEILSAANSDLISNFFAIFSSKESIFKAVFPNINHKFGFTAVRLKVVNQILSQSSKASLLELEFRIVEDLSREFSIGTSIVVRLFQTDSFALTLCALPGIL